jgi:DNA mismatch repair ATPase MutL
MSKRSEQQKAYREKNKDKIRAQKKSYREANKDKIREQRKKQYEANKDAKKRKSREYYEANKEKSRKKRKDWNDANRDKMNEYNKAYREKNHDKSRHRTVKYKYGLTSSEYDSLVEQSGGTCPICGILFDWIDRHKANRPCVDHCHESGKIRGLICGKCNAALGMFYDDISILEKAIQWLYTRTSE